MERKKTRLSDRERARQIFMAGVEAANPTVAVAQSIVEAPLPAVRGRRVTIAVGKAALAMLSGLSGWDADAVIVVTNPENARDVPEARVFAAGHPVPDDIGLAAGRAVIKLLEGLGTEDHVLALISGGGSALLPAPAAGISLEEKAAVNSALLTSGADITEMNLVRQQLSTLKGDGFLQIAAPAKVTALILSDVVGDDLRVVASGPTAAAIGSKNDAKLILQKYDIWGDLPGSVQQLLQNGDVKRPTVPAADNRLIGSNAQSVAAMAASVPEAICHAAPLTGDVAEAAARVLGCSPGLHLFGGETTVCLSGTGLGGRNQELALRVALGAAAAGWSDWVFLSGGTDGRDGPTDAAGGLVDSASLDRMERAGVDPRQELANNNSYAALKASDDLLMTGATGTNVADLQVLIRH